jgi:hypothetical protein
MPYRLLALVAASVVTLSGSALAQKKDDATTDSIKLNSSRLNFDRMGGGGGGKGAAGIAVSDPSVPNDPVKKPKTKTK